VLTAGGPFEILLLFGSDSMSDVVRVQVLMRPEEAGRFDRFCTDRGHKKSTLIARLIREHLQREGYAPKPGTAGAGR